MAKKKAPSFKEDKKLLIALGVAATVFVILLLFIN